MATVPVTPVKKESFLDKVGTFFKDVFVVGLTDVNKIAIAEEAPLTALNPQLGALDTQIAALTTQSLGIVTLVEQKFAAAGMASQTGVQKFATAASILTPAVAQILGLAGEQLSATTAALVNGAVSVLNALPAALATPATTPATPATTPTA